MPLLHALTHVALVPLRDRPAFRKVIPSKLLEAMGVGFEMGVGQLIPPLRRVLKSQFAGAGGGRGGAGAGSGQAQSREARTEPDESVRAESCHRTWTLY